MRSHDCKVAMKWLADGKKTVRQSNIAFRRTDEKEHRQEEWVAGAKPGARDKIGLVRE